MLLYEWNDEKNELLKRERQVSFEDVLFHIENGDLLDTLDHPNQTKFPHQKVLVILMNDYIYTVPCVENEGVFFLKTIIPSRKLTKKYLNL